MKIDSTSGEEAPYSSVVLLKNFLGPLCYLYQILLRSFVQEQNLFRIFLINRLARQLNFNVLYSVVRIRFFLLMSFTTYYIPALYILNLSVPLTALQQLQPITFNCLILTVVLNSLESLRTLTYFLENVQKLCLGSY